MAEAPLVFLFSEGECIAIVGDPCLLVTGGINAAAAGYLITAVKLPAFMLYNAILGFEAQLPGQLFTATCI